MTVMYTDWLEHVFDHPLPPPVDDAIKQAYFQRIQEIGIQLSQGEVDFADVAHEMESPDWYEWYFKTDAPYLAPTPDQTADYITRAFHSIDRIAQTYSDGQMNQGIQYIINNACSNYIFALVDESVPLVKRLDAVDSFYAVYAKLYAAKCTPTLGHDSEVGNPLNNTCYMWWDVIPFYGKSGERAYEELDIPILKVMQRTLTLPNIACQEGALHGLGHWYSAYPREVEYIIDGFLAENPDLRAELRDYAHDAKTGCIL